MKGDRKREGKNGGGKEKYGDEVKDNRKKQKIGGGQVKGDRTREGKMEEERKEKEANKRKDKRRKRNIGKEKHRTWEGQIRGKERKERKEGEMND